METEDPIKIKRIPKAQDTFLANSIKSKYRTKHVWLHIVHLRVRHDLKDQYLRGVTAYQISHKSLPAVFASSILYLSPMMLKGYMNAKKMRK